MITWKPKLNISGQEVGITEGFVGELLVATIKEAGPPANCWQGEFFPLRAHYFRDTIDEVKRAAEEYWRETLERAKLEAAYERMWH